MNERMKTNHSPRNATFIVSELASGLGDDITNLNITRSTIHLTRAAKSTRLKLEFIVTVPLPAHLDEEEFNMEDLTVTEYKSTIPITVFLCRNSFIKSSSIQITFVFLCPVYRVRLCLH